MQCTVGKYMLHYRQKKTPFSLVQQRKTEGDTGGKRDIETVPINLPSFRLPLSFISLLTRKIDDVVTC